MNNLLKIFFSFLLTGIISMSASSQTKNKATGNSVIDDQKIHWYTFQEATKLNKKHPKKIFMDVYTDWCGWCKRYDAVTFANPVIAKYINDNYYAVKFDAERKDDVEYKSKVYKNSNPNGMRNPHDLAVQLLGGKMSYPTVVFLNESMDMISPVSGYMGPKDFEVIINFIGSDAYKSQKMDDYRASFQGKVEE